MSIIQYANQGATRNDPLSPQLVALYEQAARAAGLDGIRVVSGGQEAAGEGGKRTGSTRHDHGNAGDIQLIKGGKVLDFSRAEDLPFIKAFISNASQLGATGIGAGTSYMGTRTFHVGFGPRAVWGGIPKNGQPAPPPPQWLLEAVGAPGAQAQFRPQSPGPIMAKALPAQPEPQGSVDGFRPPNFDPRGGGSKYAYAPFDEETGTGMYRTSSGKVLRFNRAGQTIYGGATLPPPKPLEQGGPPSPNMRPAAVRAQEAVPPTPRLRPEPLEEARTKDDRWVPKPRRNQTADTGKAMSDYRSRKLEEGVEDPHLARLVNNFGMGYAAAPFMNAGGPFGGILRGLFRR